MANSVTAWRSNRGATGVAAAPGPAIPAPGVEAPPTLTTLTNRRPDAPAPAVTSHSLVRHGVAIRDARPSELLALARALDVPGPLRTARDLLSAECAACQADRGCPCPTAIGNLKPQPSP